MVVVCKYCQKEFVWKNGLPKEFCSAKCLLKWREKNKNTLETHICKYCGKEYSVKVSQDRWYDNNYKMYFSAKNFCCHGCGLKARHESTAKTNLERYGHENAGQFGSKEHKKALIQKYGKENYYQYGTEEYNQLMLERYGTVHASQNKELFEKMENTKLKRYGTKDIGKFGTKEHNKAIKEKYNTDNPMKTRAVIEKNYNTRLKHKTLNTSIKEEKIYNMLLTRYKDVKRQYKSELYPFACDFYISELDLYIEYQGHWTHGYKPYKKSKEDDIILNNFKQKAITSKFYKQAIEVWTIKDPLKRKIAKENNLNWIEFFTLDEFINWFNA